MLVQCPCGVIIKHHGNPSAQFADILPNQDEDAYCGAIEEAIKIHEREVAWQYAIDNTAGLFRRMCQCQSCGRLFVENERFQVYEFIPANESIPKDLLAGRRKATGAAD
jgi:hypothetical protein